MNIKFAFINTLTNQPQVETPVFVQPNDLSGRSSFTIGSTTIILSDYFDTSNTVSPVSYVGASGETLLVPDNYNYAVYISDSNIITEEFVNPGDILVFKSSIILGVKAPSLNIPSVSSTATPTPSVTATPEVTLL